MKSKNVLIFALASLFVVFSCSEDTQQDDFELMNDNNQLKSECSSCKPAPTKGSGWNLVWYDNFSGSSLNTNMWKIGYPWGNTHNHKGKAKAENAIVENGMLKLIGGGGKDGDKYNTGIVTAKTTIDFSDPNVEWQVEARMKLATRSGTWPAFWLNSTGGWPNINEIDVMEQKGWGDQKKYETVMHFAVTSGSRPSQHVTKTGPNNLDYNWHTYAVAIKKDEVKIKFDNQTVNRVTGSRKDKLRTKNFKVILNLAIGGAWGGNGYQSWIDDYSKLSYYKIDYVAIYKK